MKYNYTILAQGELEENKLSKILEENGLKVDLIEIIPDVKSLVQEQSNNAEPCLLDKWEELCKRKIVEREDLRDNVRKSLLNCKLLSRRILANTVYSCCKELHFSEASAAIIINNVLKNL